MKIHSVKTISHNPQFKGEFIQNGMLNNYIKTLSNSEKSLFQNKIDIIKKENDNRIFKLDNLKNPRHHNGCDACIAEKKKLNGAEFWLPIINGKKRSIDTIFNKFFYMYREILIKTIK